MKQLNLCILSAVMFLAIAVPQAAIAGGGHSMGWRVECRSASTSNVVVSLQKLYNAAAKTHYELRVDGAGMKYHEKLVPGTTATVSTRGAVFAYKQGTGNNITDLRLPLTSATGKLVLRRGIPRTMAQARDFAIRVSKLKCVRK